MNRSRLKISCYPLINQNSNRSNLSISCPSSRLLIFLLSLFHCCCFCSISYSSHLESSLVSIFIIIVVVVVQFFLLFQSISTFKLCILIIVIDASSGSVQYPHMFTTKKSLVDRFFKILTSINCHSEKNGGVGGPDLRAKIVPKKSDSCPSTKTNTVVSFLERGIISFCSTTSKTTNGFDGNIEISLMAKLRKLFLQRFSKNELKSFINLIETKGFDRGKCFFANHKQKSHPKVENGKFQEKLNVHSLTEFLIEHSNIEVQALIWLLSQTFGITSVTSNLAAGQLHPLPFCSHYTRTEFIDIHQLISSSSSSSVCLNPYHWSVIINSGQDFNSSLCLKSSLVVDGTTDEPKFGNFPGKLQYYSNLQSVLHSNIRSESPFYSRKCGSEFVLPGTLEKDHREISYDGNNNLGGIYLTKKWCKLSYWQYRSKIGCITLDQDLIDLHQIEPSLNSMRYRNNNDTSDRNEDFSTTSISLENFIREKPIKNFQNKEFVKVHQKIGLGVTIFKEPNANGTNDVWLYNRSSIPIFVNSHTLKSFSSRQLNEDSARALSKTIVKLLPGQMIKAYDHELSCQMKAYCNTKQNSNCDFVRVFDFDSFEFSFLKGFGPNYKSQTYMECPCWIEVNLHL